MITTSADAAIAAIQTGEKFVVYNGDCRTLLKALPPQSVALALSSPPYFLGKAFDVSRELDGFSNLHREIFPYLQSVLEDSGNVGWQVGHHIRNGVCTPLDFVVHDIFGASTNWRLRNRIVWTFGHGTHAKNRFSGRHETVLWYSGAQSYHFDLDAARVPQKYRGKKFYKGPRRGEWSSNPAGKNPGDVWDIPNVKANHVEKTEHPCQFPVALAQRLVRALCRPDGLVFDPFAGVASTGVAAALEGRAFLGAEVDKRYCEVSELRWQAVLSETIRVRPIDKPVFQPDPRSAVARDPYTSSAQGDYI
ncbi:site-specific DNA-methyltransferase [Mesorhizobium abyssinicae]|uniref:DNA-methyltransferase n=1 Tax=Mesorhizobium abyssinicae TaxID=1209958 RepID=UPI002A2418E9|nr:site-specific DNA-methyltransferase [Mesorhizobium abyssinicae]MDX8432845.1 site-specific DNA-methyltransferase [Mesorhizobium abyssinicae]